VCGGFCAFALACAFSPFACASNPPPRPAARVLDRRAGPWLAENARRIDRVLAERGRGSARYDAAHPPVAVFDWDNTMMKNDIGDATFYWMLAHDVVRQPPERDWSRTSAELTDAARDALSHACAAAAPGEPLATSHDAACADELLAIFSDGKTRGGASAWKRETTLTSHAPYAWGASLLAGYTHDEVRAIARKVYEQNRAAPVGATQTIGARSVAGYVRIYEPMRDLVGALQANGFDVWIVSASAQPLAEMVAGEVGIAPDHVIGVRTTRDERGRYAYALEPCGSNGDTVITFNQGKRCWINRVVFRRPANEQLARAGDRALRPAFAAGDSDTDLAMVEDATELKLAINRNRVLLMCNAYANRGDRWMIQPMFIEPMPQRAEPYACAAARDAAGAPLRDEEGNAIADQRDSVFALP
jgi:phosphoserine phosphatase